MFVKICGITNVDDALLAAGMGADALGLNFAISPRRIDEETAAAIVDRLPPGVLAVGVFRDQPREEAVAVSERLGLGAVQLHGSESPEDCRWVAERVPSLIRALSIDDPALVAGEDFGADRLLIDSRSPGSGQVFDWSRLEDLVGGRPFILAGGLDPDNVADAIRVARPWGVDVASGVEDSPGHKDPAKVRRFVAAAREAASTVPAPPVDLDEVFPTKEKPW